MGSREHDDHPHAAGHSAASCARRAGQASPGGIVRRISRLVGAAFAFLALSALPAAAIAETDSDPIVPGPYAIPAPPGAAHPGRSGPLTEEEAAMARVAWRYFQNNTQAATGLVNAADSYPSTTLWDIGSSMAAIVSANGLGLIGQDEASSRLTKMLATLAKLRLFRDLCPNKAYQSATGERVTYNNQPGEIGCSALDVGRLLFWLRVVEQRYPALKPQAEAVVAHFNVSALVRGGELYGTDVGPDGQVRFLQEGRLGYEEYGAKAYRLWGYDTSRAMEATPYNTITVYGVRLPYDDRDPKVFGAHNYIVTESFALDGMEYGWDNPGDTTSGPFEASSGWIARTAERVYEAQEKRFEATGTLTARTEHQLAGAPYFVYDTVFSDGVPWATITDTGEAHPEDAAVALKGALGLWALWKTPYTDKLFDYVHKAYDPAKGFYEGLLESDGSKIASFTANNNGIILETLLYKVQGAILKPEALPAPISSDVSTAPARVGFRASTQLPAPAAALPPAAPAIAASRALTRLPSPPAPASAVTTAAPTRAPATATSSAAGMAPFPALDASPIVTGALWDDPGPPGSAHPGRNGPLDDRQAALASAAWSYIRTNTRPTGLVDAAANYPSSTLWDSAAALAGIVSAEQLGLTDRADAQRRIAAMLGALRKIKLFKGICPNKAFNTETLVPTNYGNEPAEIGCSAIDMGRALVWLKIVQHLYPEQREAVQDLVDYWKIGGLVRSGELFGTVLRAGKVVYLQEGRLGYEEYAAKGFALWGKDVAKAASPAPYAVSQVEGVAVAHDARDANNLGGGNYVVTESSMLDGVEFGWDRADDTTSSAFEYTDGWAAAQARHVYAAQERRAARTGTLTARTEHQLLASPYFVYDTVFANGQDWATLDATGKPSPGNAAVALKAAIGLWVFWPTAYTDKLFDAVAGEFDPERGIYEGVFETGGRIAAFTANNNGIILETLLYKLKGPLLRAAAN